MKMISRSLSVAAMLVMMGSSAWAGLPDRWHGIWEGRCTLTPSTQDQGEFGATLQIDPIPNGKSYKWQITYQYAGRPPDGRDYQLDASDIENHFIIDERNGLLIDLYLRGDRLHSGYLINNRNFYVVTYELTGQSLVMSAANYGTATPIRSTCLQSNPNFCVKSMGLVSLQKCDLQKKPPHYDFQKRPL
jgi:hypothetical protein